jgi:arylsulfatase A-like enzyme
MIDALDQGVGRILDALQRFSLSERTLVFFVGDNGGSPSPNWRLRSNKGRLYEGGIRVPFLVSWPARLPQGREFDMPVMHIDLLPTIVSAAGGEAPHGLDGVNLLPHLEGKRRDPPHEILFWGRGERFAVRRGPWKLVNDNEDREGQPELGLFNIENDPQERRDLQVEEKRVADELLERHRAWQAACNRDRN